jgi:hypothetical protein
MSVEPREPLALAYIAHRLTSPYGQGSLPELPVVYGVIRFHAGRVWVAPLGTDPKAGLSPAWIEVAT